MDFNEFLERSADGYIPLEKILKDHGLTYQEGLQQSRGYYLEFESLLKLLNVDTTSKESVYLNVCELAEKSHSCELLRLYCMVLTDTGLLLDAHDSQRTDEQNIRSWVEQSQRCEDAYRYILSQTTLESRLQSILSTSSDETSKGDVSTEAVELFSIVIQYSEYYKYRRSNVLLTNLESLLKSIRSYGLAEISAYVCFAVLTRQQSRMTEHSGYSPNLKIAFQYQKYTIDHDNGKNFNRYLECVQLYENLCRYYPNTELSDYCFLKYSNLGEWYLSNGEPVDGVPVPFLGVIRNYLGEVSIDLPNCEVDEPIAERMLLNTIYDNMDILKEYISARYFAEDTAPIVYRLCKLSGVAKRYPNSEPLAECILTSETAQYIEDTLVETAQNFLSRENGS